MKSICNLFRRQKIQIIHKSERMKPVRTDNENIIIHMCRLVVERQKNPLLVKFSNAQDPKR
jgi:hypothetical protein